MSFCWRAFVHILTGHRSDKPPVSMLHICSGVEDICGHKTTQQHTQLCASQMEQCFHC